jgi:hypothetical protein
MKLTIRTAQDIAASRQDSVRAQIKARRDLALASGTVVGGMSIATDDVSQSRITGAALAVTLDPKATIQWKTGEGFVILDAAAVIAIAQAVRAHVQACFDHEAALLALLDAGKPLDIDRGWP